VFGKLRKQILKLQPDKWEFLRKEVSFLGHISEHGVEPDTRKVEAIVVPVLQFWKLYRALGY